MNVKHGNFLGHMVVLFRVLAVCFYYINITTLILDYLYLLYFQFESYEDFQYAYVKLQMNGGLLASFPYVFGQEYSSGVYSQTPQMCWKVDKFHSSYFEANLCRFFP